MLAFLAVWLPRLIIAFIAGVSMWAGLVSIFDPKGLPKVKSLILNWTSGGVELIADAMDVLVPGLSAAGGAVMQALQRHGGEISAVFKGPAASFADAIFKEQNDALLSQGESTPDNALSAASLAMGNAFGRGLSSAAVTALFEAATPERLNTLNGAGPMLAEMAGFREVASKVLDPLYDAAFGRSLQYHYRSIYKPELPDEADAVQWHSRRLLTDEQLRKVFGYSGLKAEYEEPFVRNAYRALSPFILGRAVEDVPFPRAQMQSVLEFNGYRDADIAMLLRLFEQMSVKNVRQSYLSALLEASEKGTIDEATLDSHLDTLGFSAQAKNYVHLTVAVKKLEQLAEIYRKSVTALYKTGQLTDAQYIPALENIGIDQADAGAHYALDSAEVRGKAMAAGERLAAREHAKELAAGIAAIRAQYMVE
jgi:hypothetical protein